MIFLKYPQIENHNFLNTFLKMAEEYKLNISKIQIQTKKEESYGNENNENENEKQDLNGNDKRNGNENKERESDNNLNLIKENAFMNLIKNNVIDEIFSKYLIEVSTDCNKDYFEFVTKFVILFRECVNKSKNENNSLQDYSCYNNADTVPDTCNEFITDFMEGFDYFGLDTMELIEIIQHLCNWLYENKFTTSKLSLVS